MYEYDQIFTHFTADAHRFHDKTKTNCYKGKHSNIAFKYIFACSFTSSHKKVDVKFSYDGLSVKYPIQS